MTERDGFEKTDPKEIFVTNGASAGISLLMSAMASGPDVGFMIPIPQYPLYSAETTKMDCNFVGYYLDESKGWQVSVSELQRSFDEAKAKGINTKCIVVINPGNPTGQILSKESIADILKFAHKNNVLVIADEVYQDNIYKKGAEFNSFRKVLNSLEPEVRDNVEVASFHSCSKGFLGECGIRGGYMELTNFDEFAKAELIKSQSISLCSNTIGQLMMDLKVNPPSKKMGESDETIEAYNSEVHTLLTSLKTRAVRCSEMLNRFDNVTSNEVEGAMYAFPSIKLSDKFVEEAKGLGVEPDFLYCTKVLQNTGAVIVPGSGFLQKEGTHHFRTTILPLPEERFYEVFGEFQKYNNHLMREYR